MKRIPPKQIARKITKILKKQRPDANYLKKIFEHIRSELELKGKTHTVKKLPELLSDDELIQFYDTVWNAANSTHIVMIKLLIFTGIRNAELANIKLTDVDMKNLKCRIHGKGNQGRYVPIPPSFRGELTHYVLRQKEKKATYLFETNRNNKFTTRWIREIVKTYAKQAGIFKRIHPHLFRHQLLTFLTQKGLIDSKIQLISGHKNQQNLRIYQDLSLADVEKEYRAAMKEFPIQ
jgi:integrase/recombinase XerD